MTCGRRHREETMSPFEFLEEEATADIAFRAWGADLEETFRASAEATMNTMVELLDTIQPRVTREFELESEELDLLLFAFLQEFIYCKDAQQLLLRVEHLSVEDSVPFRLRARVGGERLDPKRHPQRVDVKAVTLHQFRLEPTPNGWQAHVILDI